MPKNFKSNALTAKRLKARYLIVVKGYSQKEAGEMVKVSERTICVWAKKYNWKEHALLSVKIKGGMAVIFNEFLEYVRSTEPAIVRQIDISWNKFMRNLEGELNSRVSRTPGD